MIPIQDSKHKIVVAVVLGIFVIVGLGIWYIKTNKTEKAVEAPVTSVSTASSSPDFIRRMAINELPDINGNSNYKKDDTYVYYGTDIVYGADPKTFEIIDEQFSKDKSHIYYEGDVLEDSDSSMFVGGPVPKDKSNVYLLLICEDNQWDQCYRKVDGADPATFEPFVGGLYKDKFHIFSGTKAIPDADIATFALHDGGKYGYSYWYDKNYIFVMTYDGIGLIKEKCSNLDLIGGYYLKCDDKVYYGNKLLVGADVKTMIPVGVTSNYAKDSKNVYFDGGIVEGADTETFTIGDGINAKDKNHTYRLGKIVE